MQKSLKGMGLVEVLVAMLLLTLSSLAILNGLIKSQQALTQSYHETLRYLHGTDTAAADANADNVDNAV
jgi:Tfp pilus assembly protein PilV